MPSRAAIICSKEPGDPDNETLRHCMITVEAAIRVITGDPGSEKCHAGNKLPQQKTDETIICASQMSDF